MGFKELDGFLEEGGFPKEQQPVDRDTGYAYSRYLNLFLMKTEKSLCSLLCLEVRFVFFPELHDLMQNIPPTVLNVHCAKSIISREYVGENAML